MVSIRDPILHPIAIDALRPTQITVGMREVEAKREAWREKKDRKAVEFLGEHMIPVILGPKERYYIIDHHHLARALHEEGVKEMLVTVIANLKQLERDAFWFVLENRNWMHAFDDRGRRRGYEDIPSPSVGSSTIPSARSPVKCAWRAASPKTRRRSASSSGPISCVAGSNARWSRGISTGRSGRRSGSPRARRPIICPVGAAPSLGEGRRVP